jgi:uncharacterized protein YbcV (DUF1398 family)
MTTPFTIADIERAHAATGPEGVCGTMRLLRGLGVARYISHISDGHSEFFDGSGNVLRTEPLHPPYPVADTPDPDAAKLALGRHARGETDYFTFARQLTAAGVATWLMDPDAMTCTFCCRSGVPLFAEPL